MPLPAIDRTVDAVLEAIQSSFLDYWNSFPDCTPIAWDNRHYDPSDSSIDNGNGDNNPAWIRFSIQHSPGLSGQAAIESGVQRLYRRQGLIFVQVFTQLGSGRARSNTLVERALLYFETREPPQGVWYRNPSPAEIPTDSSWFQVNVSVDVVYDVLRTVQQ